MTATAARKATTATSASIGAFAAAFLGLEFVLATARARLGDPLNTALGGGVVKPPHVTVLAFFATSEKW